MNELALFAGTGGGVLGSVLLGHRVVGAVENDPYCREILLRRQEDHLLEPFPIWDDVSTFDGKPWRGAVDLVSAGFPCQPFSVAGKRLGADDPRDLWDHTMRVIREVGPRFAFLENVPGLVTWNEGRRFASILADLHEGGFDAEWTHLSAAACGANHIRNRVWILAHARCAGPDRIQSQSIGRCGEAPATRASGKDVADAEREGLEARRREEQEQPRPVHRGDLGDAVGEGKLQPQGGEREERGWLGNPGWWESEPDVGRVAYGLAFWVDRLRALGNGQVPIVAARAFRTLMTRTL